MNGFRFVPRKTSVRLLRPPLVVVMATLAVLTVPTAAVARTPHGDDAIIEVERLEPGLRPAAAIEVPFDEAYDADPLGIVAFRQFTSLFTNGTEPWDVWICRATEPGDVALNLNINEVAAELNSNVAPYFTEISGGKYTPDFQAVGSSSDPSCGIGSTHPGLTPRLYVNDFSVLTDNRSSVVGQGGPGTISWNTTALLYEGIQRRAEIDGASVAAIPQYQYSPAGSIAAHEMGHTIHWSHSGAADPYDNETDLMSIGWGGTHAFNLYAAGWIAPEQVALHHGGTRGYTVGTTGFSGTRLIIVTTGTEGLFYALSVRGPDDPVLDAESDPAFDALGVEVYSIDQRPSACTNLPADSPCFGILSSISPVPSQAAVFPGPYAHFREAGSSFTVQGIPVEVAAAGSNSLEITIDGGLTSSGWFLDDDSSVFESDIEWVAAAGITRGCNPPRGDFFCPDESVTRGQMAAFLVRALGLAPSSTDRFVDDENSVFEGDINALAASGITTGCTSTAFCPDDVVTRGQMAAFLRRAFDLPAATNDPFVDDNDSVFEGDINALAASGITTGCTSTAFCPNDVVTRGQMAAFLRRADG
ncbi:MAG: S-layer homology domain-containing protein, partial [Acidimicrobiia bacterium]|nr:S-layer homology domain-containing protein [Acidimicrobiia bacterium]